MALVQGTIKAPVTGDIYLGGGLSLRPRAGGGYVLDASGAGGSIPTVELHAVTHAAGGTDELLVSALGGVLDTTHGGNGLSSYTAGDMLYYASGSVLSKLGIGASGRILTSTGSAPQWVSSLTKAQQHASTAYTDVDNSFTTQQTIFPSATAPLLRLMANNAVGASAAGSPEIRFYDSTLTRMGRFLVSVAAGNKYMGLIAETDRDGFHPPFRFFTANAAGSSVQAINVFADADAGKLGITTALGIGLGSPNTVPSATLHVVETSAGALTRPIRIGNHSATVGSAVGITFYLSSAGAQQAGLIQTVLKASSVGDMVLSVQNVAGAGPVELMRLSGSGTAPSIIFPGGHFMRKEIVGTATDWEFWHGLNTATYPNLKIAIGTGGVFNVPVSTGLANALSLTAPYNAAANWPVLSILKYQTYGNNPSDFISCAQTLDNGGSFTYPFRVVGDGTVLSLRTSTDTSSTDDLVRAALTATPASASTTTWLAGRFTVYVSGGASATYAGVMNGLTGEAILDSTSTVGVTGQMVGLFGAATHNKNAVTLATGRAVYGVLRNTATGTITTGSALYGLVQATSTGPITAAHGVNANVLISAAATIATYYGVRSQAPVISGGGAITTAYAGYFEAQNVSGVTTAYTLYTTGGTSFLLGQVLVGTTGVLNAAAALQVESTTKGFLPPRMTTAQRNAIAAPPNGLEIFNTDTGKHEGYSGAVWNAFY